MSTTINLVSTHFDIQHSTDNLKASGGLNYNEKIDNLSLTLFDLEDNHIGDIYFTEYEDGNSNVNMTTSDENREAAFNILQAIITDIKTELVK